MPTASLQRPARSRSVGASIKGTDGVGRKLAATTKKPPDGLRGQFCRSFRKAIGDKSPADASTLLGVTPDMVRKYLAGDSMPDINALPGIAKKLGLSHWTDFFKS